jgi:DNA-binding FadR family transcriptional regulator
VLAIRRLIEVEVAGQAAGRRDDADIARLLRSIDGMEATLDDPVAYSGGDVAFHEALITAGGNDLLRQMMRPVNQIRRIGSVLTTSRDPALIAVSMARPPGDLRCGRRGDAEAARGAMAAHLDQFERDISDALTTASPRSLEALARVPVAAGR